MLMNCMLIREHAIHIQREARLGVEHADSSGVDRISFFLRVTHGSQTYPPAIAQRTHHVKDHAGLACLIEVKTVARDDIEEVIGREDAVERGLLMITCDEAFLSSRRSGEDARLWIVRAVGQELQSEKRMRRAALTQIYLNRVRLPLSAP